MQEVICFNCGRIVHISPDAELCSVCSENLRELIHPAYASRYFYERAATMATDTDLLQALREIDRGLSYRPSSELRLLGAILSQRIGDFEQMRHHVAAVPVDDVLRPEAEWLLRSHQNRQREQRAATRTTHVPLAERDPLPPIDEVPQLPVRRTQNEAMQTYPTRQTTNIIRRGGRRNRIGIYFAFLLLAVVIVGLFLSGGGNALAFLPWSTTPNDVADESVDPAVVIPVHQSDTEATQSEPILLPTATPNVGVPDDVVQIIEPEPIAENTVGPLVVNGLQPFDLGTYLIENNRPDLAELGVVASSQEGTLLLDGIVPSFKDRKDLIDLMGKAPGVSRVSGANILIRLPPTYTVLEGDTLWAISDYLYGKDKIAEIIAANRDILTSANVLSIGMELKVPITE